MGRLHDADAAQGALSGLGQMGEFPLRPIELLQGFLHGVGGVAGKMPHVVHDGGERHADDLQVFVQGLTNFGGGLLHAGF